MTDQDFASAAVERQDKNRRLAQDWRWLRRLATTVALLVSPALFFSLKMTSGWHNTWWALGGTLLSIVFFRGLVDVVLRKLIPWPNLFGVTGDLHDEDIVARKRSWFWARRYRRLLTLVVAFVLINSIIWCLISLIDHFLGKPGISWFMPEVKIGHFLRSPGLINNMVQLILINSPLMLIMGIAFLGPMLFSGLMQIKAYEPGDVDWGVKLDDVRGQKEAKEEIRKVVAMWESSELFVRSGGKTERGILFLGPPGVGKTMLAKAIATSFNCPFISIPGPGFAQTFIGVDVLIVNILIWRARKLAKKWGGQCIIFIDEIDAVGMRRASLGMGMTPADSPSAGKTIEDFLCFGRNGARTASEDLYLETRAWRDRLFVRRAEPKWQPGPYVRTMSKISDYVFPGMGGGMGSMALNQLLISMDGVGSAPLFRRMMRKKFNMFLDSLFIIPQKIGPVRLRFPSVQARKEQVYFIGATNVPLDALDPALVRPGRMGRHIYFRTPTKNDRLDIFDLYLNKVAHDAELDDAAVREELARITQGYSPAMIDQVCSMALTYAQHEGRLSCDRADLMKAMTTIESGEAVDVEYTPEETRAVAIHEAGHAVAAHVYMKGSESTRLSIRKRGGSLGHHQAFEKEERFSSWRHEQLEQLVWALGAMAAEHVFYEENSVGVGGDVQSATATAAWMVGACAMAPEYVRFNKTFRSKAQEQEKREEVMKRFEAIGLEIMNRSGGGGMFSADPISGVLSDQSKRRLAAQILGQSYVKAYQLISHNKQAVQEIAEMLIERKEIYGNELISLLEAKQLEAPEVDLLEEAAWPTPR